MNENMATSTSGILMINTFMENIAKHDGKMVSNLFSWIF